MPVPVVVVIPAAGLGSRLGMGVPKALVWLCGRPLIHWQLDLLREMEEVRVVVGFNAPEVIEAVRAVRNDAVFVFNRDYRTTGTGDSLALAARNATLPVVSLDGDLLVDPEDFARFCRLPAPVIGCTMARTKEPVLVQVSGEPAMARRFSREEGDAEWTGLVKIEARHLVEGKGHVFQVLERQLPLPVAFIDTREIDTPEEFAEAERWLAERLKKRGWSV